VRVNTKSTLGVGVPVGSGVAVGGRGTSVLVGGSGVDVLVDSGVAVGGGVTVGGGVQVGDGVDVAGMAVGASVGVAVSVGVGVLVNLGMRVGVGVGSGAVMAAQPASRAPDKIMPTAASPVRLHARIERWVPKKDKVTLARITFPLSAVSAIISANCQRTDLVPKVGFEPTRGVNLTHF
jgi:hypothetical protein